MVEHDGVPGGWYWSPEQRVILVDSALTGEDRINAVADAFAFGVWRAA